MKVFSVFGTKSTNTEQPTEDDVDKCIFEDVPEEVPSGTESLEYQLPPHHRCAAHSLNLVSTTDADKAEEDPTYKRLSRGTFAKCQALWNKLSKMNAV